MLKTTMDRRMSNSPVEQHTGRFPRNFQVVIKPVGSACNLACRYCYYLHKDALLAGGDGAEQSDSGDVRPAEPPEQEEAVCTDEAGSAIAPAVAQQPAQAKRPAAGERISDELLERFVGQYIASQEVEEVVFNWHGGEPALLGLDFFRRVVELQRRHAQGKRIKNDFQTNGVLLDDEWCEFFKEHEFYVGLSIDGPRHLHDCYRLSKAGSGTFDEVCRAVRLLQKHQVAFTTLTVVHRLNAQEPEAVWRFLTEELGCTRVQWLPCAEPKDFATVAPGYWPVEQMPVVGTPAARPGGADSVVTDWSVDPDQWGEFLRRTFELWMRAGLGRSVGAYTSRQLPVVSRRKSSSSGESISRVSSPAVEWASTWEMSRR